MNQNIRVNSQNAILSKYKYQENDQFINLLVYGCQIWKMSHT